uniref:IS66 family transposase n=1 Tax=Alistipes sp. An116 TaxID=1965546 RepID=UPI0011773CA8|nr:transposase [Alistipes sp. An116]
MYLERRDEIIEPDELPAESKRIGEEITELLEYKPGVLYIRRLIRPQYALPNGDGVVIGELPSLPLPRANAGPSLLKDFRGAVQSDGYGAYDIYENKRRVLLLGCRAHIRRKFEHALDDDPERAEYALRLIGQLYAIERRVKEQGIPLDEIKAIREKKRSDMPMRYTRAWHATSQTADAASTITSRSKPYGRWHWAARTTSSAATTRRHTIRPLSTPYWGHADCVCGGGRQCPPSCNESRHSSPQGNLHKWVQDSILREYGKSGLYRSVWRRIHNKQD